MKDSQLWTERRKNLTATPPMKASFSRVRCSPSRAKRNKIRATRYLRNISLRRGLKEIFDYAFIDRERCETISTIDHKTLDVVRGEVIRRQSRRHEND